MEACTKAVIIATLSECESDYQHDYYGHRELRTIIIGYSTSKRVSFPEMRKYALLSSVPEIQSLGRQKCKAFEHREKYMGGGGYFLKDGGQHSSGWGISKIPTDLYDISSYEIG